MKVDVWIKYEESCLPPSCRKLRYRECEEHVALTLPEASTSDLRLAFEDSSYEGLERSTPTTENSGGLQPSMTVSAAVSLIKRLKRRLPHWITWSIQ